MRDKKRWVYCPQKIWYVTIILVDGKGGNTWEDSGFIFSALSQEDSSCSQQSGPPLSLHSLMLTTGVPSAHTSMPCATVFKCSRKGPNYTCQYLSCNVLLLWSICCCSLCATMEDLSLCTSTCWVAFLSSGWDTPVSRIQGLWWPSGGFLSLQYSSQKETKSMLDCFLGNPWRKDAISSWVAVSSRSWCVHKSNRNKLAINITDKEY